MEGFKEASDCKGKSIQRIFYGKKSPLSIEKWSLIEFD